MNARDKVDFSLLNDKQLKVYIADKIETDNLWLRRGLLAIYQRQTAEEKSSGSTLAHNGRGFSATDAGFCTDIAMRLEDGAVLSYKQLLVIRKIMRKYVGQLVKITRESYPYTQSAAQITAALPSAAVVEGMEYNLNAHLPLVSYTDAMLYY